MRKLQTFLLGAAITVAAASCLKQEFEKPTDTSSVDPQLNVNSGISGVAFSALGLADGEYRVLGDTIISGVVVGDDHSGNIYKQIIIQDSTAGIAVMLDKTTLYGDFPVGRRVYIKAKGLLLMNYKTLPEIIYAVDKDGRSTGIPSSLISDYVVKGAFPVNVEPTVLNPGEIFNNPERYLNTLVKLENVQFDAPSANVVYSDDVKSTSRILKDCPYTGLSIAMYNSSFSNFRGAITPDGKGYVVGILSAYNTPQLLIRDTSDVRLTEPRQCP